MEVCGRRYGHAHHAHALTLFVHHVEHDLHALALLAHEVADALAVLAEVERAGGVAVDAHLALDVAGAHVVGLAQGTVFVVPDLGNHEDGDALGPARVAFDPGQHRVNDVLGQVMVARGDEALGAGDRKGAVGVPLCRGLQRSHVGTGARLGEAHSACPGAVEHLLKGDVPQGVLEEIIDKACGTVGKTGVHKKRLVAREEHVRSGRTHDERQALTADIVRVGGPQPAAFCIELPEPLV
jgi:hypothetical protein